MAPTSHQEAYAANLGQEGKGLAIYRPLKPRDHSRKVGDIAFFNKSEGKYCWIQNAFNKEVAPFDRSG
jgi:hypothetical protein